MKQVLTNKKRAEFLTEKILGMDYGSIIYHSQIVAAINVERKTSAYNTVIAKTKKLLKENGYFLKSVNGSGYRIIMPDDVIEHSLKHYDRGFKEINKGFDVLCNAPTKNMSKEALDTYRRVTDRAIILNASMKGAAVELKTLGNKNHPFALNNIKNN